MVYAFILHTVGAPPGLAPEPSRLLYQRLFSCGSVEEQRRADEDFLEKEQVRRKGQVTAVARQVESLCLLRRQFSRPATDPEEALTLHEEDVGVLGLPPGEPFPQEMTVLWVGVHHLAFSLICDPQENLTLAEMTLRMMVKYLLETLRLQTHSSNAILRADKMELVLDAFIPQGALLFLSHQAVQALEKELSSCMTL